MPMSNPLGLSDARDASGTAWQPDDGPSAHAHMRHIGAWAIMLHTNTFVQYIEAGGDRGDRQFGSANWFMGAARRSLGAGQLTVRTMLSAEPLTVGRCGYPDLGATGESCRGVPLHDRQHPHDLFMEVAAQYRRAVSDELAVELYGGAAGEPALGPAAYPHRPSATPNPFAPIAHHWLDSTHVTFGVVSAGVYGRRWKLEGSLFNGREPDDKRYGIDVDRLDSRAARLWIMPTDRVALQVSAGRLEEAETIAGGRRQDVTRVTASATYHRTSSDGFVAGTAAWGLNREANQDTQALLGEVVLDRGTHAFFARAELTEKSIEELVLLLAADEIFRVAKVQLGATRTLKTVGPFATSLGASVAWAVVADELAAAYGTRSPIEFAVFLSVRPR
jgi:hypothetical protein